MRPPGGSLPRTGCVDGVLSGAGTSTAAFAFSGVLTDIAVACPS